MELRLIMSNSCSICSEVPKESDIWNTKKGNRLNIQCQAGIELVEGYAMRDHIHMLLMIPPKHSVAHTIGFLKGKSAIRIFREYLQVKRNFSGRHFWARGYCVSTVELDEQMIREYIKNQEREEKRQEQMRLAGL